MEVYIRPFGPKPIAGANTVNLAVTGTSGSVDIGSMKGQGKQSVRVVNSGTQVVFLDFSNGAGAATLTADMPMLANSSEVFLLPSDITHVNAIAAAVGSTLYITIGEGT